MLTKGPKKRKKILTIATVIIQEIWMLDQTDFLLTLLYQNSRLIVTCRGQTIRKKTKKKTIFTWKGFGTMCGGPYTKAQINFFVMLLAADEVQSYFSAVDRQLWTDLNSKRSVRKNSQTQSNTQYKSG